MGYVPPHLYIITGDERYRASFERERKIWGIIYAATYIIFTAIFISLPLIILL